MPLFLSSKAGQELILTGVSTLRACTTYLCSFKLTGFRALEYPSGSLKTALLFKKKILSLASLIKRELTTSLIILPRLIELSREELTFKSTSCGRYLIIMSGEVDFQRDLVSPMFITRINLKSSQRSPSSGMLNSSRAFKILNSKSLPRRKTLTAILL